tara:strand:+ start:664 stop:909 length:246 start_codon:yes stop_codon:yes gene_type:complete
MAGPFKMKKFSGFGKGAGSSPAKHTSSRGTHMRDYGKDHTNKDHPNYWDKNKMESDDGKGTKKANQLKDFLKKSRKGAAKK